MKERGEKERKKERKREREKQTERKTDRERSRVHQNSFILNKATIIMFKLD